jgi:hypothetical protein
MLRSLDKGKDAWDGKAETTADLGLGFLLAGIPKEGLKYLHEAQAQFRSKKQYESLLQSLRNEALYLEKVGQKK